MHRIDKRARKEGDGVIYSFLGLTDRVFELTNEAYPGAKFLVAKGNGKYIGLGSTNVTNWIYFFLGQNGGTIIMRANVYGEVSQGKYYQNTLQGYRPIPWPFELDLSDADGILKDEGIIFPYSEVDVLWPYYTWQPVYLFKYFNGQSVSVGIYSKTVV